MKISNKFYLLVLFQLWMHVVISHDAEAQAPQAIPYQAVARDASGNVLASQPIAIRFSVHTDSATGNIVYQETQNATTTSLGLFSVNLGQGITVSGSFPAIDWASGSKYLQVELDPLGGSSYTDMGTTQLMSVPYALQAGSSSDNKWVSNGNNISNANTGNVGIGNANPTFKLDVASPNNSMRLLNTHGNVDLIMMPADSVYTGGIGTTNSDLPFWPGGLDRMMIKTNGNVGIGTNTPAGRLHVLHTGWPNLDLEGTSVAGTWMSLGNSSIGGKWFNFISTGSGNGEGPGKLLFSRGSGPGGVVGHIMAFDHATANVGIGTVTPQEKLEVVNNLRLRHANGSTTKWGLETSEAGAFQVIDRVRNQRRMVFNDNGNIYLGSVPININGIGSTMTLDTFGRVGIGTTTPMDKLHVNGHGRFGNHLKIGTDVDEGYFQNSQDGAYRALQTGGTQGYWFQNYYGAQTAMYIGLNGAYQGRVGIGTTTPEDFRLHVAGNNNGIKIMGIGTNQSLGQLNFGDGNYAYIKEDEDDKLKVKANRISLEGNTIISPDPYGTFGTLTVGGANLYANSMFNVKSNLQYGAFIDAISSSVALNVLGDVTLCPSANNSQGNMSVGKSFTYSNAKLTVASNQDIAVNIESTGAWGIYSTGAAAKPGGGSWSAISDRRLKENIVDYQDGLTQLLKIRPVKYHYNKQSGLNASIEYVGVLAQDLQEIAPYMVRKSALPNDESKTEYLNVDNSAMIYMLVNAVKEQQAQIEALKQKIETMGNK